MLFDSWSGLIRVLVVGSLAYASLVLMLRVSGKRTLSKMNAFDLVVTVALGSVLATVLLAKDVALAEGLLAFGLLILLQYLVAWLSARSPGFRKIIKAQPRLLLSDGKYIEEALLEERIARGEVMAAIRSSGYESLDQVTAVVLETDGTLSVIGNPASGTATAMRNVGGRAPDHVVEHTAHLDQSA